LVPGPCRRIEPLKKRQNLEVKIAPMILLASLFVHSAKASWDFHGSGPLGDDAGHPGMNQTWTLP
jgi:hypothetical protein